MPVARDRAGAGAGAGEHGRDRDYGAEDGGDRDDGAVQRVGELDSKSIGLTSAMIAFERIPAAEGRHMLGQGGSRWGLGEQRVRLRKAAANY